MALPYLNKLSTDLGSVEVRRVPRSLAESPVVNPAWRFEQAAIYYRYWETHRSLAVPQSEDRIVVAVYSYLTMGTSGNDAEDFKIRYAFNAVDHNEDFGAASRLKAFVVAGLPQEEIAVRMGCPVDNVRMFEALFFDVRDKLDNKDYLRSVVFPFCYKKNETKAERQERLYLATAHLDGLRGLEVLMGRDIDTSTATLNRLAESLYSMSLSQGYEFMLSRRVHAGPTSEDFDRLLALMQVPKSEENQNVKQHVDFSVNFMSLVRESAKNSGVSLNSEARAMAATVRSIRRQLATPARPWSSLDENTNNYVHESARSPQEGFVSLT